MKYRIDKDAPRSAYMQLYTQLREDIVTGAIPRGSKLPSKRLLAGELGVSLITVEHAYALLCDEGYVDSRQRSGYFAAFGAAPRHEEPLPRREGEPGPETAPEDFPFSALAKTMRRVLSDYDRRILVRSPGSGCPELREAIAIVQLFGRETVYALEDPCYVRIRQVYEANGARCVSLPMGEDGIVTQALAACRAGVLHVTPFNSYPSHVTASAGKRHEYAAWARKNDSYLIEDDYDSEFSSVTRHIDTICSLAPERVLYLNTFSRTFAPSMRTAYLVLPQELLPVYREKLGFSACTVPVFEQYVLAEFLSSGELERYINRRRRKLRQQKG